MNIIHIFIFYNAIMGDITKQNVKRFDARSNKTSRGKNNIILAVIFVYGFNTQILINGQVCNI